MYQSFSPFGAVEQTGYNPSGKSAGTHLQNGMSCAVRANEDGPTGMPVFQETDLPDDVGEAVQRILSQLSDSTTFLVFRSILKTPTCSILPNPLPNDPLPNDLPMQIPSQGRSGCPGSSWCLLPNPFSLHTNKQRPQFDLVLWCDQFYSKQLIS